MVIVNSHNLFLNSAHRSTGTSSEYRITLYKAISLQSPNNWFSVRVGSAEIPYVFKLINTSNNTINYSITRGTTSNGSFVIAPGNYNILQLLDEIKAKLANSIQALIGFDPTNLFTFTYDRNNGFVTFSIVGIDSTTTSITIQNNSQVFMKCIGYISSFTFGYTNPSTRTDSSSTQNVNVYQNPAVYIRSDTLVQSQNMEAIVTARSEPSDILAKVQVNCLPQTMIQWTNPTDLVLDVNNKIIDEIGLYLGSTTEYVLDLGNLDWTIRITIDEHADDVNENRDLAINMSRGEDPYLTELIKKREAIVTNLSRAKENLIPKKNGKKEESER
jgi:hypothetical protein